jgi:UDP-glucose 4-epimerase
MTILIIGCKGFIGSNAIRFFRWKGYDVVGCDTSEPARESYTYFRISNFENDIRHILLTQPVEACLFASGAADVGNSFINTRLDYVLNVHNVQLFLEAARETNLAVKFINTSSAAVYGNPATLPVNEASELNPVSPYGQHKLISEKLCREYASKYNMKTVNLRIFSAYGEGQKKMLFYDLYKKAKLSSNVELFGSGDESRDFIYIDDLLEAMCLIVGNANFEGESINVANGEEIRIKDAVKIFYDIFNPATEYHFTNENRKGDPINWKADVTVLKSYGYSPRYTFKEGLINYCNWLNETYR